MGVPGAGGVSEAVSVRPTGPLRDVVAAYHGYCQRGVPPGRHLGLPSPFLTVIFTLHEPLRITRHVDPRTAPGEFTTVIGGLHRTPAVIEHDGAQSGIQLQLSPLAARGLFGMPAGELAGTDDSGSEVLGRFADELQQRLAAAGNWPERFALLDRLLGQRLTGGRAPAPEVRRAWRELRRTAGRVPVARLAADVGWSGRHLARRFEVEIGLTPKVAARVIRFDRARRLLASPAAGTGAQVAARCGFADQAHLVRDFVAFTGTTPSAWLAAEVGNLLVTAGTAESR